MPKKAPESVPTPQLQSKEENDIIIFTEKRDFGQPLRELAGKTIVIEGIEKVETKRGTMLIIIDSLGNRYYTFSEVIQRQLEPFEKYLLNGKKVKAKVEKVKNMLRLAQPD